MCGISYPVVLIYRRRYSHNRRGDRQEEGSLVVHTAAPATYCLEWKQENLSN